MQGVGFEPTMLYAYPLKGYVLTKLDHPCDENTSCSQIFIVLYL